ncbi:MAG TPA: DUF1800 family protein, partial [Candidatus Limnocylindrales bacterium]|nr:DUF1800 family protein [Candidatus Limnocylindrales bacterium]
MPATRKALALPGLVLLAFALALAAREKNPRSTPSPDDAVMSQDRQIVHALNRFTFGIRPGDVERVRDMGLDKWFEEQLHPEKINDSALETRLSPLRTLKMS